MKKIQVFLFGIFISRWAVADFSCPLTVNNFDAIYEPNEYTCNSGEFLPANAIECTSCPSGQTCLGGTFNFDPDRFNGLTISNISGASVSNACAANMPVNFDAVYEPNEYTCNAGYYLPANVDSCTQCPANSYCAGGTYTFNETTDQGIEACANGYSSVAGSSSCTPNTITVRWDDGNGGAYTTTCTYGGTLTTPTTPPVAPKGHHFTGWTFNLGN